MPGPLTDAADEPPVSRMPSTCGPVRYAASGGMFRALVAAREALTGVREVVSADGRYRGG